MGWMTILLLIPAVAMLLGFLLPAKNARLFRTLALGTTLLQAATFFAFILPDFLNSTAGFGDFRLQEQVQWIRLDLGDSGLLNISYHLGLDGISLVMVMITVVILPIVVLSSFEITKRIKTYFALFFLMDLAMLGCFMALDFFL